MTGRERPYSITVHHLEQSRSLRILWTLEELELDYQVVAYQRLPDKRAPPALEAIHPLGKSPVVQINDRVIAESGAIIQVLLDRFDSRGELEGKEDYEKWVYFMHFAEGSAMLHLLTFNFVALTPKSKEQEYLLQVLGRNVQKTMAFIENHLASHEYFAGRNFSAADIMMSMPVQAALLVKKLKGQDHGELVGPKTRAWLARVEARPAYRRAEARDGNYKLTGSRARAKM
ncbi:hypothetical protein HDU91_002367 [Kappamyces sp. JEL0680]|nr:hypothetical protein HDU91_002367 [Kappamyces sp. JEL0680]